MVLHGEGERARLLTDRVVDGCRRAQHRIVEQRQALGEGGVQRARALHELHVERLGTVGQRGVERDRIVVEHRLQLLCAIGKRAFEAAAGRGELVLERDQVLPRAFDDLGQLDLLLRQLLDQRGHLAAHRLQGLGDLVGRVHERMALADQLLDQAFDLVLVLVVGLLQRRHLVVDQRLELAGPPECARDRLVHERDLPAHRLTQRGCRLLGGAIGLRKAHRHLGHGRRHQLELLGPAGEQGQKPEKGDRQNDGGDDHHQHGAGDARPGGRQRGPGKNGADDEP